MKRTISVLLAACSLLAVAEEPKQPAATPLPIPDQLVPPAIPEGLLKWLDADDKPRLPTNQELRDAPMWAEAVARAQATSRPGVCYFIRTTRPVPADADAPRSGFIRLQARTSRFEKGPDCSGGAALMRTIPAMREIAAVADSDSSR